MRAGGSRGLGDGHAPVLLQRRASGGRGHQPACAAHLATADWLGHAGAQLRLGETLLSEDTDLQFFTINPVSVTTSCCTQSLLESIVFCQDNIINVSLISDFVSGRDS